MKYSVKPIIRKDQLNKQGECPLYIRYTFNRKSVNIPVGESILLTDWDDLVDMPKISCKRFRQVYDRINYLSDRIHLRVGEFEIIYARKPECQELKGFLNHQQKTSKVSKIEGELIEETFKDFIKISKKEKRASTIAIYNSTLLKWLEFERTENKKYFINDIKGELIKNFRLYLMGSGLQLDRKSVV